MTQMLIEIWRAMAWFGLKILLVHQCVTGIH